MSDPEQWMINMTQQKNEWKFFCIVGWVLAGVLGMGFYYADDCVDRLKDQVKKREQLIEAFAKYSYEVEELRDTQQRTIEIMKRLLDREGVRI